MKAGKIKRILAAGVILTFAVGLAACGAKESEKDYKTANGAQSSEEAADSPFGTFKSQTLDGEDIDQEVFTRADVTMVNIWGTFCGPCVKEMPGLGQISRDYQDQGVQLVGIIADVDQAGDAAAKEIRDETKADYTHIVMSTDLTAKVRELGQFLPTTVFLDKNGRQIGESYQGARSDDEWIGILDKVLEEVKS